jgi:diguanylate cyclase (GGDEF)-like protein/PAS domain S-box-containing protein
VQELEGAPKSSSAGSASDSETALGRASEINAILDQLSQSLAHATASYEATIALAVRMTAELAGGPCILWLARDGQFDFRDAFSDGSVSLEELRAALGEKSFQMTQAPWSDLCDASGTAVVRSATLSDLFDGLLLPTALAGSSVVLASLPARGEVRGVISVIRPVADGSDDALLRQVGDRLALAIDNARLIEVAEQELARATESEEALRASKATTSIVARSGPILLFACDGEGIITLMDGGLLTQFQLRSEAMVGKSFLDVFGDYALIAEHAKRALEGEPIRRAQIPFEGRHLEAWAQPLRDQAGSVTGFAGIVVDVSAKVAAEAAVLDAARRQAALVEHASDVIIVLTGDGTLHYVNPACQRVLGYAWRAGDVIDVLSMIHPDDREICRDSIRETFRHSGTQTPIAYRMAHADGTWRHLESIGNNLLDDPAVAGVVVTLRDVTAQRETEVRLLSNAARQAALAELGRWALVGLDYSNLVEDAVEVLGTQLHADIVHVFESYADASLLTLSASKGQVVSGSELMSSDPTSSPASFALVTQDTVISEDLREEDRFDVPELWTRAAAVSVIETPIPGEDLPVGVLGIGSRSRRIWADEDINFVKAVANVLAAAAARTRADHAIRDQALQDPLTGLPNRLLLADHSAVAAAPAGHRQPLRGGDRTVFVFDIDRFKEINDTLGHAIGDIVLIEVARRLQRIGEPIELVARLGGDEFAVVARTIGSQDEEHAFAYRLLSLIGEPIDVAGVHLRLRGSVGIAAADPDRDGEIQVSALLRRAEAAMYQAKSEHAGVRRYVDDLERSSLSRLALASELAEAIDHGQLRLDYQPKTSTKDGRVTGVEALVRWQHPTRGLLLPDVFVPLAEQTGIIRELTNWVLARALAECASWQRAGWRLPVAVNLSAGTVHDPSLLDSVMAALARAGLPPEAIELEITESAVMLDPEGALRSLEELTQRGVRFALDDFGTGYSSLAYLQRLPVTSVKIDKSFVKPLFEDEIAQAIVRAVVELGHSLHLSVIAEGVDSAEVMRVITMLGCDAVQGFHIAMPMAASELRTWIAGHGNIRPSAPLKVAESEGA